MSAVDVAADPSSGPLPAFDDGSPDPLVGLELGAYVIRERIGDGGMGVVYRADQPALGRSVAIKVLHRHLWADEDCIRRFDREARAASRLNHPNSVGILDFGTLPGVRQPYLVMEYLRGRDLAMVLAAEGPILALARVRRILLDVLSVLSEAHELGIVHRDLKPENLMVIRYRDGVERSKVLDFGLARMHVELADRSTLPGIIVGTPEYMAPEAIAGEDVDGRADLYSLGVILFQLLTGRLPWAPQTIARLLITKLNAPVPDPADIALPGRVLPRLARATRRALSKAPADRFATAEEMRAEIEGAFDEIAESVRPREQTLAWAAHGTCADPVVIEEHVQSLAHPVRRALHAAAVLGCAADVDAVGAIAGGADAAALAPLLAPGLVRTLSAEKIELEPTVQRIVYNTIPWADRRELHDRALVWHGARGDSDDARLRHALHGSEPLVALVLLERMTHGASEAGRHPEAIELSRHGLLLSRRELDYTGEDIFERAHLTFARKLADALSRSNRRQEAEGVLLEALDRTPPASDQLPLLIEALREIRGGTGS